MENWDKRKIVKQIEQKGIWGVKNTIIPNFVTYDTSFITNDEFKMYNCLRQIYNNDYIISTQVALNRILKINTRRNEEKLQNEYWARSIDFVIYNTKTMKIECCIELNGKEHEEEKNRKERDIFLQEVFEYIEFPLIFIKTQEFYKPEEIKKIIKLEKIKK